MAKTKSDTDTQDPEVVKLRAALETERAGRATAETRLAEEGTRRREAEKANMTAQERSIVTAQEAADSKLESLEATITQAKQRIAQLADEPGHGVEIADLQVELAEAVSDRKQEQGRKAYLEAERQKFATRKAAAPAEETARPGDIHLPNGAMLSSFSPKTQAWLRAHPKAMTDPTTWNKVAAAAGHALNNLGLSEDSDDYFDAVEQSTGLAEPRQEVDDGEEIAADEQDEVPVQAQREAYEAERPQHRAAGLGSMQAPASRRVPQPTGNRSARAPSLTSDEREVALSLYSNRAGMSDADKLALYAKNKQFMDKYQPRHFSGRSN